MPEGPYAIVLGDKVTVYELEEQALPNGMTIPVIRVLVPNFPKESKEAVAAEEAVAQIHRGDDSESYRDFLKEHGAQVVHQE